MASEQLYLVFARRRSVDPLRQIGVVKAASAPLAFVYARHNYTERPWQDLAVAPRSAFWSDGEVHAEDTE